MASDRFARRRFLPLFARNRKQHFTLPPIRMASRMETARKIGADEESFAADAIMGRLAKQVPEPRKR